MLFLPRSAFTAIASMTVAAMLSIAQPAAANDALETLLERRDTDKLAQTYINYVATMPEAIPDFPQEHAADWRAAAELAYKPEAIKALVRDIYTASLSPEAVDAQLAFMKSDIGVAVEAAEGAGDGYSPGEYEDYVKKLAALAKEQPDRYALYQELQAVQYPSHSMVEVRKVLTALLAPLYGKAATERYLDGVMPIISDAVEPGMMILVTMAFGEFSDEQIKAILAFSRSPAGQEFVEADKKLGVAIFQSGIDILTTEFAARVSR